MAHSHHYVTDLAHLCLAEKIVDVEIQCCCTDGLHQVRSVVDGELLLATWDGESRSATTGRPLLLPVEENGKLHAGKQAKAKTPGLELIGVGGLMWLDRRSWEQLLTLIVSDEIDEPPAIEEVKKLGYRNFFAADTAAEMAAAVTQYLPPKAISPTHAPSPKPNGEEVLRQFVRFARCGAFTVFERDF